MKKFVIFSVTLLLGVSAWAQKTVVKGAVLDSLTRQGEPSAILQFFRADDDSKPIAFTTTDEEGNFSQALTGRGGYYVLFSNMGRKAVRKAFTLSGEETLYIGVILAEDDAEVLKAGSVTAQKTLVVMEVDKMTYKVEDDVDSKTSTVLDMLRKVPMVSVDGQDNITVNGSSSFQVYVDGKPNQMMSSNPSQVFKMMPASAVKNIEVITNPGVKYDAEGVGGVLNITTNREATGGQSLADGQYGTLRAMGSTRGFGGGLFYSMQKGKWALSLNGNAMHNTNNGSVTDINRTSGDMTTSSHSETDMTMPMWMGNLNLSYEIDSLNLVSVSGGWMHFGMESEGTNATAMAAGGVPLVSYDGTVYSDNTRNHITAGADYQHNWAGIQERTFTLSYQYAGSPNITDTRNTFHASENAALNLTDRYTDGKQDSQSHTVQADFTTPLGGGHSLSTGAKFISRHNSSDQNNYNMDGTEAAGSLHYDFYNRIGAAYTEYSGQFGAFGLKAGIRYEHTWQHVEYAAGQGEDFRLNYGNWVPTASLQYNISPSQNIGLSYNMRISRPGITYLNPYVDTSDPTAKTYGNTDLKTERGHNISLVYNFFSPKWVVNLTLRHSATGNGISQYSFYDEDNLLNTTYGNIVRTRNTGLNAFVNWMPAPKTRIMLNGGIGYADFDSETLGQRNSGWNSNAMLGVQQTLPWDLRVSANLIYSGKRYSLQGWNTGMSMGMLGVTKSFMEDKLGLSLMGVLNLTGGSKGLSIKNYASGKDFTSESRFLMPVRQIMFSVSWSFGQQAQVRVKSAKRSIQNDEQLNSQSTSESLGGVMPM